MDKTYADLMESYSKLGIRNIEHWEASCDYCKNQEGRDFCKLFSLQMKDMDFLRCDSFEWKII